MSINISQRAGFPAELSAAMTGSFVDIGTLTFNPVAIFFFNNSEDTTAISTDGGSTTWKTFAPGETLHIPLRNLIGRAANFTFDKGTTFSGNGATGTFSISYIYALT